MRVTLQTAMSSILLVYGVAIYAGPPFTIHNQSNFYLNSKESGVGCPKQIAPGGTAQSNEYWCGFIACATGAFDEQKGCMEKDNKKAALTEGGYATWFSISFGTQTCVVPDTNVYQCSYAPNGNLTFDYRVIQQKYSAADGLHQANETVKLPQSISVYDSGPKLRGVNISGLEYDGTFLDALYQHPDIPDIRYFVEQGMNLIRLPIRLEFLFGDENNQVNSTKPMGEVANNLYLASIYDTVEKYLKGGVTVDLDLHNYMRFCATGTEIGQANEPTDLDNSHCQLITDKLAAIWARVLTTKIKIENREVTFAELAKAYPDKLILGLMNEPYSDKDHKGHQLKTKDVFQSQLDTVRAIRKLGITNLVMVSGNYWDPLHGWSTDSPFADDEPNGVVFNKIFTPAIRAEKDLNIALEMHQYFDSNYSGTHPVCRVYPSYNAFKDELDLDKVADWVKTTGVKVFLGEFGAADNTDCKVALNYMMRFMNEHAYNAAQPQNGGFIGWAAWRANRHGHPDASRGFNYLHKEDYNVYGGNGTFTSPVGMGVVRGFGNGLMDSVFAKELVKPVK